MTDEELKALVAENSRAIRELREESEKQRQEDRRSWKQLREELRASRQEFREELRASRQESERIWQEVLASRKDFDRVVRGLRRDVGNLGNALGGYTESLLRPPLERLLRERFGMRLFHAPLHLKSAGEGLEIDLLGHAKDIPEVYAVEIKSKLRPGDFDQLFEHLRKLPLLVPEHRGKKLFGMLAALEIDDQLRALANRNGSDPAGRKDDSVELSSPDEFEPHAVGLRGRG